MERQKFTLFQPFFLDLLHFSNTICLYSLHFSNNFKGKQIHHGNLCSHFANKPSNVTSLFTTPV